MAILPYAYYSGTGDKEPYSDGYDCSYTLGHSVNASPFVEDVTPQTIKNHQNLLAMRNQEMKRAWKRSQYAKTTQKGRIRA